METMVKIRTELLGPNLSDDFRVTPAEQVWMTSLSWQTLSLLKDYPGSSCDELNGRRQVVSLGDVRLWAKGRIQAAGIKFLPEMLERGPFFVSLSEILKLIPRDKSTIARWRKNGNFPKAIGLSERRVGYIKVQLDMFQVEWRRG